MQFKDYYQTLGVARDATAEEIKKAFRKLARKYHPDVSKEPDAEARMKEVNEAYTVLVGPGKARRLRPTGQELYPRPGFPSAAGLGCRFRVLRPWFSPARSGGILRFLRGTVRPHGRGGGFRAGGHDAHFRARGEDHHAKVLLDLEDAFTGATRQITLRAPELDAQGHVQLRTRTLNVKIPQGVRAGQTDSSRRAGRAGLGRCAGRRSVAGSAVQAASAPVRRGARSASEPAGGALGSCARRRRAGRSPAGGR